MGDCVPTAEVAVEAYCWVFGWRAIVLAGTCVEMEELVEAGKVGFIWWFIVVSRFRIGATEDSVGKELEGRCSDGAFG